MSEGSKTAEELLAEKTKNENLDAVALAASNARLLKESQEYKEKYKRALSEKEELESKKLAESGDKEAQLKAAEKKAREAQEALAKTTKKVISQAVKDKVQKYAGEVHSIEDLLARPSLKTYLKEGLDEDKLDFNDDVAKKFVEETKKEAPYLWKTMGGLGVNTNRASSTGTTTTVDTSKMSGKEMREYIAANFK